MKLSFEQHSELSEMARHFYKIEEIAERLGIEVDSLVDSCNLNDRTANVNMKPTLSALTNKRQQIFRETNLRENTDRSSIVNLTVIVNEARF